MLQPNKDRLDYGSLLMPPEGFQVDNAIATTYSLDLDALVSIPVALYFSHSLDLNVKQDLIQVLDSIRRAGDTVRVFCQKGQIKVPENQHRLYSFLEPCVVQIPPTHSNSFHPKLWVIRYRNSDGDIKYRVIILSRNLTFDRSWDVAFQLEGHCIQDRKNNFSNTRPLVDFVKYLSEFEEIAWLKTFLADLGKTEFRLSSNEFDSFSFLPSGFNGYQRNVLFDGQVYDELLIVSPFITKEGLDFALKSSQTTPKLFSREAELKKISREVLGKFSVYHLVSDFIEGEERIETDTEENLLRQLQDLHAKVYSFKSGWDAYLFLGSANCSERAMYRNIEFMIQLKGKNSKIGPGAVFKDLVNDELRVFQNYNPAELLSENEKILNEQGQELQRIRIEIVNAPIKIVAVRNPDSNYSIEFELDLVNVRTKEEVEAAAYMLNGKGQSQNLNFGKKNLWATQNIAEPDLSCFLIIELGIKDTGTSLKFAMKTQVLNLPQSRSTRIFRDIISNTANFFKYIRFLLAENYWDEDIACYQENGRYTGGKHHGVFFNAEEPIYENMLKAISREPGRLAEIKKVIEKLSEEENNEQPIIPEDFKTLWGVFEEVQRKKK